MTSREDLEQKARQLAARLTDELVESSEQVDFRMGTFLLASLAAVAWQRAVQGARLMVGVPDYDAYVAHLRDAHPDVRPLTRDDFLRAAQDRRYGRGTSRCC